MEEIRTAVNAAIRELFNVEQSVELTRTQEQFGDYTTNAAMQLARPAAKPPREVAETLAARLREVLTGTVQEVTIAGPGFINIKLSDQTLAAMVQAASSQKSVVYANQTVITEYSDPNPFKVLHAGHLYTSIVGDAISNLIAAAGGNVHRVNFGGDVGLHVGKTMWAILQALGGEHPEKLKDVPENGRSEWMAQCYVTGTNAYEDDDQTKEAIVVLNKRVYQLFADNDHESPFAQIYWTCRQWSYAYFDAFYDRIGTHFEKYYPESEVSDLGLQTVRGQLAKGVFKDSDGAVVFDGEAHGLHTRVFINSHGIPTYEAKDVGLIMRKWQDYHFDRSVVITGSEQEQYMAVVLKAVEQFAPEMSTATTHITHGLVKLQGGVKMSSRKGNFLRATDVLDVAGEANKTVTGREDDQAVLGAVKYAFLKQRIGADIIYDPAESVSLEGNSGPYLQYAHARARSILRKVGDTATPPLTDFDTYERSLARKITEYPEVIGHAVNELMPHHVCTYLYELAQEFNRFYEHAVVIRDPREGVRLQLVHQYADILKDGLTILGITAPEQI